MHLSDQLKTCSDQDWHNAILVALAAHKDIRIQNLASGYDDAEIGKIAVRTPTTLLLIAGMVIDAAFKALTNSEGNFEAKALARDLGQTIADKEQLDVFLALSLYSESKKYAH